MNSEVTIRLFRLQSGIKRLCTGPGYMWLFEDIAYITGAQNTAKAKEHVRAICNGRICPAWEPVLDQMERALEAKGYEPLGQDVK
jgi:hypothetical protein